MSGVLGGQGGNTGATAAKTGGAAGSGGGIMGGQWSILPLLQNLFGGSGGAQQPGGRQGQQQAQQGQGQGQNQDQQPGGHWGGLVPNALGAIQNHEKTNMHLNALKDPNLTPEWRAYHTQQLQQMHANNPQWLQANGFAPPGQAAAAPSPVLAAPVATAAAPVAGGK